MDLNIPCGYADERGVRVLVFLIVAGTLWGQSETARAAMEASIEKQRQSIRTQANAAVQSGQTSSDFFTVPWPKAAKVTMAAGVASADCEPLPKTQVDSLVTAAATREGVKPELIRQVMQQESAFRPCAISVKGAQGLMQLMPATAGQFGVVDPFNPEQNVAGGVKFLKQLLTRYNGDVKLALAAYNAGPGAVDRAAGVPNFNETQKYVAEIVKGLL
jgi:soluble lytic murein transglycosylase-like protein